MLRESGVGAPERIGSILNEPRVGRDYRRVPLVEQVFDNAVAVDLIAKRCCACPGCAGSLTESDRSPGGWGFCRVCRCAWKTSTIDGRPYATAIHTTLHTDLQSKV